MVGGFVLILLFFKSLDTLPQTPKKSESRFDKLLLDEQNVLYANTHME